MLFSIIIPVYNTSKELPKCIESIMKQTYKDFEIVLIDDGSTDCSGELIDSYSRKYQCVRAFHIPNSGVSSARNYGLAKAKGKYIVFIDSDDYVDELFLQSMIGNSSDLYIQGWQNVSEDGIIISSCLFHDSEYNKETIDLEKLLINGELNCICAKRFKNEIIHKSSLCFNSKLDYGEDTVFVLEYLQLASTLSCSSLALYKYVQYENKETLSTLSQKERLIKRAENSNRVISQLIFKDNKRKQKKIYLQRMKWVIENVDLSFKTKVKLYFSDEDYRIITNKDIRIKIKKFLMSHRY